MTITQLNNLTAATPFLQGVPNSIVSPPWFRLLTSLTQAGNDTQFTVADVQVQESFDDGTGYNADAASATQQLAGQLIEQLLQDGADNIAAALRALQDAIVEQATLVDVIRSMASQDAGKVKITGGSIDGTAIGATTRSTGVFTGLNANGAVTFAGVNVNVQIKPTGTGTIALLSGTLGSIDNMSIGQGTAAAGAFTTVAATGAFGCNSAAVQTSASLSGAATDLPTVIALCNQIRSALINNGICA